MINALYVFGLAGDVQVGFEWRAETQAAVVSNVNTSSGVDPTNKRALGQATFPAGSAVKTSSSSSPVELPPAAGARVGPLIKVVQKFNREIHGGGLQSIVFRAPIKNFENRIGSNGVNSLEWAKGPGYYVSCRFLDRTCVAVQATEFYDDPEALLEDFSGAVFGLLLEGVELDDLSKNDKFMSLWNDIKIKYELEPGALIANT
ncbi:hypothetical protein FVE85_1563 [Porphyridium purpureum]|uniref:Uncharacterized protein n=1 Tax=Porphyridium purpureum TaxID=35688 RepID=A0A5J4YW51_PORPP|nr:hypothetical protein FVE85_1563 [Porphyridium purpureum]|eukprot:POR0970..scf209_3